METRVALISIIVEDIEAAEKINHLLHNYRQYISIAVDGPMDEISALSGKLGAIPGVSTKTVYSKV